ncbi:MAG: phosphate signaling complex protein PhoU [Lachnospiraceae bacterium]|nr:phosphate signaling complex protein PhoU [Lachnospiraceae bacterium]
MRSKFDEQLRQLNSEMIIMSNMIEKAIQEAIEALFSQNVEKAKQIMEEDELVDREQKKIENICFQLLIQQQPVAKDLRNITAAMKMVTDMERIGDQAADISELTVMMGDTPFLLKSDNIKKMATETILMLIHAVEAYVEGDMEKAKEVIEHDDIVDDLFLKVKSDLIEVMKYKTDFEEQAADLLMVNKYLERIGDHATNIAEWVIFSLDKRPEDNNVSQN